MCSVWGTSQRGACHGGRQVRLGPERDSKKCGKLKVGERIVLLERLQVSERASVRLPSPSWRLCVCIGRTSTPHRGFARGAGGAARLAQVATQAGATPCATHSVYTGRVLKGGVVHTDTPLPVRHDAQCACLTGGPCRSGIAAMSNAPLSNKQVPTHRHTHHSHPPSCKIHTVYIWRVFTERGTNI